MPFYKNMHGNVDHIINSHTAFNKKKKEALFENCKACYAIYFNVKGLMKFRNCYNIAITLNNVP